jgi:Ankyrin repeats (3 copies)
LVISAIVNVAQDDVQEDWVLEVIGHQGVAVNLTLAPGEMILYESHSVIHGRPFPLRGKYYANWFFHFEPVGYTQELIKRQQHLLLAPTRTPKSNKDLFQAALAKLKDPDRKHNDDEPLDNNSPKQQQQQQQRRISSNIYQQEQQHEPEKKKKQQQQQRLNKKVFDLPYYIEEGTREATRWRQEFVFRRQHLPPKPPLPPMSFQQHVRLATSSGSGTSTMSDRPHSVAAKGDLAVLIAMAAIDPSKMDLADRNGWKPIHEAARAGRAQVVRYLVETHQVNINERTNRGQGGSPLWWAEQSGDDATVKLLQSYGAESIRPELF